MRIALVLSFLLLLPVGFMSGCASDVAPTVSRSPSAPFKKNAPIYVLAATQRARVLQSLTDAGLNVSDELGAGGYSLTVKIGSSRKTLDCGTVNNVVYIMNASGAQYLVMKGRGPTGSCQPNILDDMAKELATLSTP